MKLRMKVDSQWLELERKSMRKLKHDYKSWEEETLHRARSATDLRTLRQVFYDLGPRWEWDQATGSWLTGGQPLDTIGLVLRMPGLHGETERYAIYAIMAYSKGLTRKFDHLGDKERIIVEKDLFSNRMQAWSTTGHGAMDIYPTDLSQFEAVEEMLKNTYLVAQPGDHALRLEAPLTGGLMHLLGQKLWYIAAGNRSYEVQTIDLVGAKELEEILNFNFYRYAKAVINLEQQWNKARASLLERAKEAVEDKIPEHIEKRVKRLLRVVEGLLHILWFKPPYYQLEPIRRVYLEYTSQPSPIDIEKEFIPLLDDLSYALNDLIERAKYLKWKSVIDRNDFGRIDVFKKLELSEVAREAFIVALDDILKEHTLSYIGYPERATIKGKITRGLFALLVLPWRLLSTFWNSIRCQLISFVRQVTPSKQNVSQQ